MSNLIYNTYFNMTSLSELFVRAISFMNTKAYYDPLDSEKNFYILQGLIAGFLFTVIFSYVYYRYFGKDNKLKKLFLLCVGLTLALILAKYSLNFFDQTYLVERILFFAFPSPRLGDIIAFLLAVGIFVFFMRFRNKIEQLPARRFVLAITAIFIFFTLSVASLRIGIEGIGEPFTHHRVEYTGALEFARPIGLKNFLTQFSNLVPVLPLHPATHPPGYVVFLHIVATLFNVGDFGLAIAVVIVSSFSIGLLYLFWRDVYSDSVARRMVQVLMFVPSWVIFTATSMDALNYFIIWLAVITCFFGWKRSYFLSFFAGLAAGYAIFSNYLFVFMLPLFLALLWFSVKESELVNRRRVLYRVATTLFAFVFFFLSLWLWARYSIITNFFAGHEYWQRAIIEYSIDNNINSFKMYFIYAINNLTPFIWYLGAPVAVFLLRDVRGVYLKSNWWFKVGLLILSLFIFTGLVLGGETERILLFLVPLFLMFPSSIYDNNNSKEFNAILCLLFFQIIMFQIAFHTYW